MTPQRIQRRRTKGWRTPENTKYVGRGSKWGNPWRVGGALILTGKRAGEKINAEDAVEMFRKSAESLFAKSPEVFAELTGKNLSCWCPLDQPCHADVLLELANGAT